MKRFQTLDEVARRSGIPLRTLQYQCKTRKLKARKKGKSWVVDVFDMLERNGFDPDAFDVS